MIFFIVIALAKVVACITRCSGSSKNKRRDGNGGENMEARLSTIIFIDEAEIILFINELYGLAYNNIVHGYPSHMNMKQYYLWISIMEE